MPSLLAAFSVIGALSFPLAANATIQDDAPALLTALAGVGSGGTLTLANKTYYFPYGLTLTSSYNNRTIAGNSSGSVIVGGAGVTGWTALSVFDTYYSTIPSASRSSVYTASISALSSLGLSSAELYVGGSLQSQTRWPQATGGEKSDGWYYMGPTTSGFELTTFTQSSQDVSSGEYATWNSSRYGSIVVDGWSYDGAYFTSFLSAFTNPSGVYYAQVSSYSSAHVQGFNLGGHRNTRYRYRNILEELKNPGEYWIDTTNNVIYWYPPTGVTPSSAVTYLSCGSSATITFNGASHITIDGGSGSTADIAIVGAAKDAIDIGNTSSYITLKRLGIYGAQKAGILATDDNGTNILVDSCDIQDTGNQGVYLRGGSRFYRTASNNRITNCILTRTSRTNSFAALNASGMAPEVDKNYVHDVPAQGILLGDRDNVPNGERDGANDALVQDNWIDHACTQMCDMGAVYFGRSWAALGNHVTNNLIDHINPYIGQAGTEGGGWNAACVYLDDCQAGATVSNNTLSNSSIGLLIGGGWGHTISGNLFDADTSTAGILFDNRSQLCQTSPSLVTGPSYKSIVKTPTAGSDSGLTSGGPTFRSITEFFPSWGSDANLTTNGWHTAYDNIAGTGKGLAAILALYTPGSTASATYGEPLWVTIDTNYYKNMTTGQLYRYGPRYIASGYDGTNSFGPISNTSNAYQWTNTSVTPTNTTAWTTMTGGGASSFAGRTSPMTMPTFGY